MMSTYFVGPFGRMLPVTNGSSEQEPTHSAYSPAAGNSPYRLPPPPQPAPLQFGTDPFLHHRAPVEKHDFGRGQHWTDTGRNEQLPSVSQLLTPVSRSSAPPPHHHTQPFATPTPSYTSHHDSSLASSILTAPVHEHKNLPPISHIPVRNLEDEMRPRSRAQSSSSVPPLQRNLSSSSTPQHKGSRDIRSSETTTRTTSPAGNGPQSPPVRSHVIDERYIDGEGLCYVYANGSYCPKIIDGTPVNANWGVTKAGKPRKRLAQACLTCREKKIKCHPNLPKCDQCQKAGRVCRFENAPRGNRALSKAFQLRSDRKGNSLHNSPDSLYTPRPSARSTPLPDTVHTPDSDTLSTSGRVRETDPDQLYRAKKRRLSRASAGGDEFFKRTMNTQTPSDYTTILMDVNNPDLDDPLAIEWSTDPYEVDPEATSHYIETYLTYVNDNLYPIFPRRRFLLWLKSGTTRSLDDKMLLYCMLAMGCIFSDRPDKIVAMKRYSRTARYAVEHNRNPLTLQMAQSRIIMSLWYYAIGALLRSWDSVGAAARTVCGLRYNIEPGVVVEQSQICEYGLHPQALIECRRRTFWVAFLLDRFSSFYSPSSTFFPSQMAFLRLPCREDIYEAQEYATVPYFQSFMNAAPLSTNDLSALSPMAFLIEIMSLWSDVSDQAFRLSLSPAETYSSRFEEFYATVIQRSDEWAMKLPNDLTITAANLERSIHAKKANAFISNHLFYHATLLKLNRCARQQDLRAFTVDQCIRRARHHSVEILRICLALMQYMWEYESTRLTSTATTTTTTELISIRTRLALNPCLGYLVLSAVDILSAAGPMSDLAECIHLIRAGLDMVRELAGFWDGALPLVSLIETRMDALAEALHSYRPDSATKLGFVMDNSRPGGTSLDSQIRGHSLPLGSIDQDLIYGRFLSRERVLVAVLGVDDASLSRDSILWIREGNF